MFDEDLKRTEPCTFDELKDDEYSNFIAVHHEFVASAKAVIAGHRINPDFVIGNMLSYHAAYPLTLNPADMLATQWDDRIAYFRPHIQAMKDAVEIDGKP